jgi:hypothetical protein
MGNLGIRCFDIVRRLALAAVLLYAPLAIAASGLAVPAPPGPEQTSIDSHCADTTPDVAQRIGSSTGSPLHCCRPSGPAQEIGLSRALIDDKPLLPAFVVASLSPAEIATFPAGIRPHDPVHAPPRFILFGNFRS